MVVNHIRYNILGPSIRRKRGKSVVRRTEIAPHIGIVMALQVLTLPAKIGKKIKYLTKNQKA